MQFISRRTIQLRSRTFGGTTEKTLLDLNRDIRKYLILKQITITAEYLPEYLPADW